MPEVGIIYDKSIASLTGSTQVAVSLNGNRKFLGFMNPGSANASVSAHGGIGLWTLNPGGSIFFDRFVAQNAFDVIGTAGQPFTIWEG